MAKPKHAEQSFEVTKSDAEWKAQLSPEAYRVLREHGTERAGTSPLDKEYAKGTFLCAGCGLPLFAADPKSDSRTGWPSFWQPLDNAIGTNTDRGFFMVRTEEHCRRCGGDLGHGVDGGTRPAGPA